MFEEKSAPIKMRLRTKIGQDIITKREGSIGGRKTKVSLQNLVERFG